MEYCFVLTLQSSPGSGLVMLATRTGTVKAGRGDTRMSLSELIISSYQQELNMPNAVVVFLSLEPNRL